MPIRPHGRGWEVRVQHAGSRTSRTFARYQDAREFERKLHQQVADHRVGRAPQYSLEEAVERWLYGEAKALRSHGNLEGKVRVMLHFIEGRKLTEIAEAAEALKEAGLEQGLKAATINRRLAIFRRVGRLAFRRWKWLDRDEAGRIQLLPGEEPRYVQASQEQAEKLLKAANGKVREAIRWAMLTGLRKSELLSVQPTHFQRGALLVTGGKTGKPGRVPLAAGLCPEDFPYGLTDSMLTKSFQAARKAAGMPWLQFRDLRRTFGSWIVQRTHSLKAAQDLLRHTTPTITARHYAHLLDGDLLQAVKTLPKLAGLARGRARKKKVA